MTSTAEETRTDAASSSSTAQAAADDTNNGSGSSNSTKPDDESTKPNPPKKKTLLEKYTPRHPRANTTTAKFGKAQPLRDALIFLFIISFLFFISWNMSEVGKPETDPKKMSPLTKLKQMRKRIVEKFERTTSNYVERWNDCNIFVTKSSIPNVGLGIFAGKNYSKGDIIFDTGGIPIPLSKQQDTTTTETPYVVVDSFALLLKHHPTLNNIEGDLMLSEQEAQQHPIIATRSIQVGEELFLSYNNHPHGLLTKVDKNVDDHPVFHTIPLLEDYNVADEIIQEQLKFFKATKQILKNERRQEIGYGLRSTKYAVGRFNPKVASLLPSISNDLIEYREGGSKTTKLIGISNNTQRSLALNGMCFDDITQKEQQQEQLSGSDSLTTTTTTLVAKRAIKNQTVAFPIPLYVKQLDDNGIESCSEEAEGMREDGDAAADATDNGECATIDGSTSGSSSTMMNDPCMTGTETSLLFCPLLFGSFRIIQYPSQDSSSNADDEEPNIELKWSDRNFFNEKIKIQSIKTITTDFITKLSWDAIALRDIEIGEEFVAAVKIPSVGPPEVGDHLIPKKWRDLELPKIN